MGRLAQLIVKTGITFTIISVCSGTVTAQPIIAPTIGSDERPEAIIQEVVVINTYADSLRSALAQKHHAENIIEVLFAEEVGKLPDISIADSLTRLPGVTANRTVAGASEVSLRGMGPAFVNGTLNGREVVTSLASRNIQYDQYPSELLTGAAVYKSPMASIVEGGVAGTIDLRTIKPLDYDDTLVAINLRGSQNNYGESLPDSDAAGFRGGVSYIDQFVDGTLAVALGYAIRKNPFNSLQSSNFTYRGVEGAGDGSIPGLPAGVDPNNTVYLPFGYEYGTTTGEDTGDGYLAAIQWAPSEAFELNVDTLYSTSDTETEQWGLRAEGIGSGGNTYANGVFKDNALVAGTIVCNVVALDPAGSCTRGLGMDLRGVNELFEESSDLFAGGVNAKWDLDAWTVSGDLSYSKASQSSFYSELSAKPFVDGVEVTPAIEVGVTSAGAPFVLPAIVPEGLSPLAPTTIAADFSDPATNRITRYSILDDNDTDDDLVATAIDVSRPVDGRWVDSVQAGLRVADRDKEFIARDVVRDLATPAAIPTDLILDRLDTSGIDSDFRGNPTLRLNRRAVIDQFFGDVGSEIDPVGSWRVEEKTQSAYVQVGFESSRASFIPYNGNIGFRVVRTATASSGTAIINTGPQAFKEWKRYSDILPSLNVSFYPEDFIVRLALSRTIARPAMNQLSLGFDSGFYQSGGDTFVGGNPFLDPYRTTNFDMTWEKYWDDDRALTLALFYKDLESFIARQQEQLDIPDGQVLVNRPANGSDGNISGIEVLYQQPFTGLRSPFDGFGMYANYSFTETSVDDLTESFNSSVLFSLDGVSQNVANFTLWYSKYGIDARLSYRLRDDYTRAQRDGTYITNDTGTVVDFQFTYDMAGLGIEGLDVFLQANNLTNEPTDSYYGNPALRGQYRKFGRNFSVGFTYKLNTGNY